MASPSQPLRVLQIGGIFVTGVCIVLTRSGLRPVGSPVTTQYAIVLLALMEAVFGFTLQRLFNRAPGDSSKSPTPAMRLARWKLGNILRLASAISVGLFGLILYVLAASSFLVYLLFGLALALLLFWSPGPTLDSTPPES